MTIHASKLSTSKKYNKEVFCIMFAAKSVPAYRIRQQFRSGAKINAKSAFEGGNLAASKIRNLECPSYEICLIDYGCGKFNRKIHIMEQYP